MKRGFYKLLFLFISLAFLWGCGGGGEGTWIPSNHFAVVVGIDSSYSSGNLSTVDLSEGGNFLVQKNLISNLSGDTIVKTFGEYTFIIERPSWGTVDSPVKVYKNGNWGNPTKDYTLGRNIHDLVFINENLAYAIPWGESFIQKINPLTGEELKKISLSNYSYGSDNSPNATKGLALGGRLFVILQRFDPGSFSYESGVLVAVNLASDSIEREITLSGKNPSDIKHYEGKLYIVETGEYFNPTDDKIDILNLSNLNIERTFSNPLSNQGMDIVNTEITKNGKAYILGYGFPNSKVYRFNLSSGNVEGEAVYTGGYITSIKYDPYLNYLFILDRGTGEGDGKLAIYDIDKEEIIREIPEAELGYPPYSVDILAFD